MGGWGVSRVRRVECGAVLLPVSSVAVSSASVIRHAWVARCRLSGAVQAAATQTPPAASHVAGWSGFTHAS